MFDVRAWIVLVLRGYPDFFDGTVFFTGTSIAGEMGLLYISPALKDEDRSFDGRAVGLKLKL
mgnify:CR=1 FL=1